MSARSIRIAPLARAHAAACAAIVADSEPRKTPGKGLDCSPFLAKRNSTAPVRARVAVEGADVAGFIIFRAGPVFARGGQIRALAVSPDRRSQGIGSLLSAI